MHVRICADGEPETVVRAMGSSVAITSPTTGAGEGDLENPITMSVEQATGSLCWTSFVESVDRAVLLSLCEGEPPPAGLGAGDVISGAPGVT